LYLYRGSLSVSQSQGGERGGRRVSVNLRKREKG
jgi:hypothetical protein